MAHQLTGYLSMVMQTIPQIDRKNTDYDEGILISDVMTDLSINMTGILVGDVDGSYIV